MHAVAAELFLSPAEWKASYGGAWIDLAGIANSTTKYAPKFNRLLVFEIFLSS